MDDNIKDLIDDDDLAQTLVMRNAQLRVLRNQRVEWIKERRELRAELDDCKKWKDITASNHNHLRQQVINHLAEIRQLRQALEELFTAYQTLDEETRPADVLPLELIQDIMPQIEQALKGGE